MARTSSCCCAARRCRPWSTCWASASRCTAAGRRFPVAPLTFRQAQVFLRDHDPADQIERYAVAGGMPLYLRQLAKRGSLKSVICEELLSPFGFLFDEPREVLEMELSSPAIHFSLLSALARHRELDWEHLLTESNVDNATASRYVRTLQDLHLVQSYNPMFSKPTERKHRYRVSDPLMRFWFRFVFPYQEELAAGMRPDEHFARSIQPFLTTTWPAPSRTSAAPGCGSATPMRWMPWATGGAWRATTCARSNNAPPRRSMSSAPTGARCGWWASASGTSASRCPARC